MRKNKKGGIKLTTLPIFILLFGILFLAFYSILSEMAGSSYYDIDVDESYKDRYYNQIDFIKANETYQSMEDMVSDEEAQYFTGDWDAVKSGVSLIGDSYSTSLSATEDLGKEVGVPKKVMSFVIALLMILMVGAILAFIRRWKT